MATVKRYIYDFDPTGRESANLIKNERHTITPENRTPQNVIIPGHAPYFRLSLIVKDMVTGLPLQEGIDYTCEWPIANAADNVEGYSPVYGGIQFIDNDITGQFEIQYQTIGGQYALDGVAVAQALANQANDPLTTTFEEILGRPIKLPPLEHVHSIEDFVGFEDLCNSVDRLRAAIELLAREDKDAHPGYETLVDVYFDLQDLVNGLITRTGNLDQKIDTEINKLTTNTNALIDALRNEKNNDISELRTDLTNKLNTAKQELANSITSLGNELEGKLNAFKTETGNNFTNVRNSITSNYNDLKGKIDAANQRIDAANTKNNEQDGRLTAIEAKNTQQDNRLTNIEAKDTNQDNRLTAIETKNTQQDTKLAQLESKFGNFVEIKVQSGTNIVAYDYTTTPNAFIHGIINTTDAPTLGTTSGDYNGFSIKGTTQLTQFLSLGTKAHYIRVHDDHTNPSAAWTTEKLITDKNADEVLNALGNVVFTTRNQNVDGIKNFLKEINLQNTSTVAPHAGLKARIAFNASDVFIYNPSASKYFALRNDGTLKWGGKDILWKEGTYLRNFGVTATQYGGYEIERDINGVKQYWRFETIPTTDATRPGAFKLYRTKLNDTNTTATKAFNIYFPIKDGTVVLDNDLANYVTLGTSQTITAVKKFNAGINLGNTSNNNYVNIRYDIMDSRHVARVDYISIVDYYMRSDRRVKDNIKPIENALDTVSKINGYTYTMKENGKPSAGIIAQQLQEVLPDLVGEDDSDEKLLSVRHNALFGYLIEAIKELKVENDSLKERLAKLEAK